MTRLPSTICSSVAALIVLTAPAPAQTRGAASVAPLAVDASKTTTATPVSVYTTLDLKTCKRIAADRDGGRWSCGGPKGFEVQFSEGDLRHFLSHGPNAAQQRAASQTLGPFNSIFKETAAETGVDRATLEWRGVRQGSQFVPYATIVRYWIDTGDEGSGTRRRSQVLVVTKLGPAGGTEACHVAYIDAVANKDANALAAKTADESARGFDCRREPSIVGNKGSVTLVPSART